jgi:hypothetical protein
MRMHERATPYRSSHIVYVGLALVALLHGGCLWIAAGAAGGAALGYVYCKGNVCQAYTANFDDAWPATHTALAELGFPITKENRENFKGAIECTAADGERIHIHLDIMDSQVPAEGPLTKICVRVATFGDYPVSERILNQIGAHLVPAPAPFQTTPPPLASAPPNVTAPPPPASARGVSASQSGEPPLLTSPPPKSP